MVCVGCEFVFYRAIRNHLHPNIAFYTFIMLLASPGMYQASAGIITGLLENNVLKPLNVSAYLPATFTMYTTMLAFSHIMKTEEAATGPSPFQKQLRTCFWPVFWIGLGAILGWPFSGLVGVPFVVEFLLLRSLMRRGNSLMEFWQRFKSLCGAAIIVLLVVGVDMHKDPCHHAQFI